MAMWIETNMNRDESESARSHARQPEGWAWTSAVALGAKSSELWLGCGRIPWHLKQGPKLPMPVVANDDLASL